MPMIRNINTIFLLIAIIGCVYKEPQKVKIEIARGQEEGFKYIISCYVEKVRMEEAGVNENEVSEFMRKHLDEIGEMVARAFAEFFASENERLPPLKPFTMPKWVPKVFVDGQCDYEMSKEGPDGVISIERKIMHLWDKKGNKGLGQENGTGNSEKWDINIESATPTLEESKKSFSSITGYQWPQSAIIKRHGNIRSPLLGDGETYIVITVDKQYMEEILEKPPPWGVRKWQKGPIPPNIGYNCGLGYEGKRSISQAEEGPWQYDLGSPELTRILTSTQVSYACRNRAPQNCPAWYNGDIIIIDPETFTVSVSSWDK